MRNYRQLSLEEREKLCVLHKQGFSLREIGKRLHRSDTTLGRELKRNQMHKGGEPIDEYVACKAEEKARKRSAMQRQVAAWKGPEVYLYVRDHLRKGWSPEAIAGRLTLDHPELSICHETIYQTIYAKQNKKHALWNYLTVKRKKRMKKEGRKVDRESRISEAVSIDKRATTIQSRTEYGHWESDNVIGRQTNKTALSVTVERTLRLTIMSKLKTKTADEKAKVLFERLAIYPELLRQTMTFDNGSENARHMLLREGLDMLMYFCHAYSSWEKGSVENMNGRIRRFIPKGLSMDTISEKDIAAIEWQLNNTPRKCLGWKTPLESLHEILHTP